MRQAFFTILMAIPCLSAAVDPALVGIWRLDAPGMQLIWQVASDGHYQLWGLLSDSGTIEASGGKWVTVSRASQARQNGTYSVQSRVLATTGPLGSSQWQAETAENLKSGLVPRGLPKMAQDALAALRRTAADAVLVMVEVEDPAPLAHPILLRFYSKKTNHVYVSSGAGALDLGPPTFAETPLPVSFIDLPQAVESARASGMQGVFGHALLRVVAPQQGSPVAVWQVGPKAWDGKLARSVDAASGKALDTARLTPMTATDGEIAGAVGKIKSGVQAQQGGFDRGGSGTTPGAGQKVDANLVIRHLKACGSEEDFVDTNSDYDKPVTFPAIHFSFQVYTFTGKQNVWAPLRPLRPVENKELSGTTRRLQVNFPPGFVFCAMCFLDGHSVDVITQRMEEIADSGC